MRLSRLVIGTCVALLAAVAHAHAFLDRSEPRVGSMVPTAPTEVRIWFTQELEPAFSTVAVTDANGRPATSAAAHLDAHDATLLEVPLTKIAPGQYTVSWRVVSVDTHVTEGRFTFRVGP
jgi:copper resistance protein C